MRRGVENAFVSRWTRTRFTRLESVMNVQKSDSAERAFAPGEVGPSNN